MATPKRTGRETADEYEAALDKAHGPERWAVDYRKGWYYLIDIKHGSATNGKKSNL